MRTSARLPLLAAAACVIAFVALLGFAYAVGPTARLDATALHGLAALRGPWADPVAHLFTRLADPLPMLVMLGGIFACGWALGRRRQAIAAVALVSAANVTTQILKVALAHPRVQPALGGELLGPEAFPSGHATAAMSIALAAVLVAPARWRVGVAAIATAYVIGVCTSLLVLVWHFPSDVLGGLLVASGCFFCAVAAVRAAPGSYGTAARERIRLAVSPRLGEAALVLLAGVGMLALLRAQDLLSFARVHTAATATALAIVATAAGLVATAALIADDRP
ncbi:MAG TPA: phosphatase PAP2 family protein [Solirubrobacterales bacterium]|jgi:membrane-associated phospholipid phosphatase